MSSGRDGWSETPCRRCARTVPVPRAGVCAPCLLAVRLGEDDDWAWGELHDEALAPGRPRQLVLDIKGIALPETRPVRMPQAKSGRRATIPPWLRSRIPDPVRDDPRICPVQVPGQLGLFPTPARQFARTHAARIADRSIPGFEAVAEQLQQLADERRVRARTMWIWRLEGFARLALAARDPDQHQVATEALKDLLYNGPILGQALDRAGFLAPPPPRRVIPPRGTGPTRQGGQRDPELRGQCTHCLAWANDRRVMCAACTSWCHEIRKRGGTDAECDRCHRTLMLSDGMCRMCRIVIAETEVDTAQIAMKNGDQLWFARPHAAGLAVGRLLPGTAALQGRFALKRRRARARAASASRPSEHLLDPAQLELFPAPPRDWSRLDTTRPPAPTSAAAALVADFTSYMRGRGWSTHSFNGSTRTLRIVTGHLGAEVPIQESDIRALASTYPNLHGARVINYLRLRGLLDARPPSDPCTARARHHATAVTHPAFSTVALSTSTDSECSPLREAPGIRTACDLRPVNANRSVPPVIAGVPALHPLLEAPCRFAGHRDGADVGDHPYLAAAGACGQQEPERWSVLRPENDGPLGECGVDPRVLGVGDRSVHNGGPVEAWCCESHSVTDAHETAERVVACLLEWRDWLEDMAERFEQLAPHPDADAEDRSWHLERAVTRLVTAVVNSTHAESSWYGLCETTLTWFLTSTGLRSEEAQKAVEAAIGGRFKSHVAPAPTLVDTVGEDLAIRLTGRGFYRER
ncbi:hypothetical protein E6R60_10900 [Streptomyces sp. A0642]|uniref:hypothetical protein n=1 Tax=Streptomyces sp. A0642 TaxID=2563100 RepID=UPI0010A250F1|nr:hypothetical protein [Streptomyces sp. A0642]THA77063.1 hypothetical protein E6R60_10900 [Streptomyces sp. A0642]